MADNNQPATKQDLLEVKHELKQDVLGLRQDMLGLKQEMLALEDRLIEKMRDMQTEVLRAFHDWARPTEIKLRTLPMIEERLGLLEERISRIERQNPPNQ